MANLIYVNQASTITWTETGGDELFDLSVVTTSNRGRQGALRDFGVAARPLRYAWRAWVEFKTATPPVIGEVIRVYLKTSDGTHPDNDDGTGDAFVSAEDKLKNLMFLGNIVVDEATADIEMVASGVVELWHRWAGPVFWNATADDFSDASAVSGFSMTEMPLEVQ